MLICFFDVRGIIHKEFVPQGHTVNGEFYREVLRRLRNRIRRARPQMWADKSFVLHHDNAPAHTSLIVREFLASPDLAPCDFFLFPKMKMRLKGRKFDTVEEIQEITTDVLNTLTENDFQRCFEGLKSRWDWCINSGGDYF
ncbi:Mariner Mos1 transposase [Camponotus japonicus]